MRPTSGLGVNVSKGHVQAYLESSKARRKRRNTLLAVFAGLVAVLSLVGLGIFLGTNRSEDTYQGVPASRVLENVLKSALGKPAHSMTFQEFKAKLYSMNPPLVKGLLAAHCLPMEQGYNRYMVDAKDFIQSTSGSPTMSVWLPRDQADGKSGRGETAYSKRVVEGIDEELAKIVTVEITNSTRRVVGIRDAPRRSAAEALDHFSVSNQGMLITFTVGGDVEDWHERQSLASASFFGLPRGGAYGYKANFLGTFGEPDRMATAGRYLDFEYNLREGKVALSVWASYWDTGVFWVRSLKYEGAYND